MRKNYYKLNREGSTFWQRNNDGTFTKRVFNTKDNKELNNIYLIKINDSEYEEYLSKLRMKILNNTLVYPLGVDIDLSKLTPSNSMEVLESFNAIKLANANVEYYNTIIDLLEHSHYCEQVTRKKEENDKIL